MELQFSLKEVCGTASWPVGTKGSELGLTKPMGMTDSYPEETSSASTGAQVGWM